MLLEIDHREVGPATVVIKIAGRMMLGPDVQKIETLVPELLRQGYRNFIFDVEGVTHMDSTGIGKFIFSFNKIHTASGKLRMAGANEHVRESFRITRLDSVFPFYPTVEAATQDLS